MILNKSMAVMAIAAVTSIPMNVLAQSPATSAPLGSRKNPIPVTAVGTPVPRVPVSKAKKNGAKRGSKANPIAGVTHPRTAQ